MSSTGSLASIFPGSLIAGRYTVEHALGKGGMGSVYAVRDRSTSKRLALKYLQRQAALENGHAATLFQREYHTLSHLRHPRVIQVYDYGVDEGRPFYTMELLDGSDLRELAALSWPRACAVLRDVASSLGLLHSRRLLHRDLSPRNVRCTRDGRAKLIDFGTMSPMGVSRDVAGTAPYMAPEAVNGQVLDARTDLYALGALAYWTLTGYDAYPARDSRELPALWTRPILSPSAIAADIPPALDALVMSLLSLDAEARPGHVAEVIERLTAIAGLEPAEPLAVAHAFLTSPNLVGHGETLAGFRKRLVRAARGRGSAVVVRGAPGLGRSRLLQALVLEAKLSGVLVLSADADDAQRGELGVACTILEQLAETAPDLAAQTFAPFADVLGNDFRSLLPPADGVPAAPVLARAEGEVAQARRARRLNALREWLLAASAQRPLLVAVDDADHADDGSAVWLTLLGGDASREHLVVAVSYEREAEHRALAMLSADAVCVELEPLDAQDTTRLLRSVFGDVPNLQVVAHWVHGLAGGVPRTVMELAQYLVDHRIARYERGSWTLPATLRDQALPHSFEHALDQQLDGLGAAARELAEALALLTDQGQLELDELATLCAFAEPQELYVAVDELIAAQVLVVAGAVHHLRHRGLARALIARTPEERRRQLHVRIATVYEQRSSIEDAEPDAGLLAAYHRYLAGDVAACLARLADGGRSDHLPFARSREAVAMYEACLAYGEAAGLSPRRLYPLRKVLLQLSSVAEPSLIRHAEPTLEQLARDSGRIYYDELASEPDPLLRIRKCVSRARAQHERTEPALRGLDPVEGMFELGASVLTLTRAYMVRNDPQSLRTLVPLIEPLSVLSPGFDLLHELALQTCDSLTGQDVQQRRLRTLSRLELPMQGLD
ncbi:MAG TPA: protein kinase, partial [Polyangiales bacterium]|nr:protein kinase [Polyangiales bacterium]